MVQKIRKGIADDLWATSAHFGSLLGNRLHIIRYLFRLTPQAITSELDVVIIWRVH
jgi:hypothetical protein